VLKIVTAMLLHLTKKIIVGLILAANLFLWILGSDVVRMIAN
jgi:hypothetical protein